MLDWRETARHLAHVDLSQVEAGGERGVGRNPDGSRTVLDHLRIPIVGEALAA